MDWSYILARTYNKLLSQEALDALPKYNVEASQKFKTSRNSNETDLIHDVYEHAQEKLSPSIDEEQFQECCEFNTDKDLSHLQMISWISSPVKNILMINLIKFSRLIKHINKLNLKLKLHIDK